MNKNIVRETVLRLLREVAPDADTSTLEPDKSFHDQFEIDSIDFLRLMMGLERELKITIFDFDYPKLSTLHGCERYLSERLVGA